MESLSPRQLASPASEQRKNEIINLDGRAMHSKSVMRRLAVQDPQKLIDKIEELHKSLRELKAALGDEGLSHDAAISYIKYLRRVKDSFDEKFTANPVDLRVNI